MAEIQRQKFSIFHNELLDFLLLDGKPGMQRRAAIHFGVEESSISVITNSDIFKARLRDRQDAKHEAVVMTIQDRLIAAADLGLEKVHEKLRVATDLKDIGDTTDKLLGRLGYGPKNPVNVTVNQTVENNTMIVNQGDLAAARARILNREVPKLEQANPPAPDSAESILGEVQSLSANVLEAGESHGREEAR